MQQLPPNEMQELVKSALWSTFKWDWVVAATFVLVGECTGVFSCYFISFLIDYLRDEQADYTEGIKLIAIFSLVCIIQQLCRNYYIHLGYMTSIRMRRTLVAVIFDKVCHLSMKSLIETNSGKLISVISADLFAAERSLAFSPIILAFPFVNAFTYTLIGLLSSWANSLIVFGIWIIMVVIQVCSGRIAKNVKMRDSALNDERLKLVNDMVVGVRTLKSYGWENHYLSKITTVRKRQQCYLFMINSLATIGFNLFQNLAVLSTFLIFYYQWSNGIEIEMAKSFAILAMVYYLFVTVNQLAYLAVFQLSNFLAILSRIASVLRLEQYGKRQAAQLQ